MEKPKEFNQAIVLVDLAGVGRSAGLQCQMYRTARDLVGDLYPISKCAPAEIL